MKKMSVSAVWFYAAALGVVVLSALIITAYTRNRGVVGHNEAGPPERKLIWQTDFSSLPDGPNLPSDEWRIINPEIPVYNESNQEQQIYTDSTQNVRIENGVLVIEAHDRLGQITSGRVDTMVKDEKNESGLRVRQGSRIEARLKLPKGKGTWPAFWLLSANRPYTTPLHPTEETWRQQGFYKHDGELDIMEHYGHTPGTVEATAHVFAHADVDGAVFVHDAEEDFHDYTMDWFEDRLIFSVDGREFHAIHRPADATSESWPFTSDNEFYVILNLAMGGVGGGQIIRASDDNWRFEIASVKYFEYER